MRAKHARVLPSAQKRKKNILGARVWCKEVRVPVRSTHCDHLLERVEEDFVVDGEAPTLALHAIMLHVALEAVFKY
jgi:hypothetical protein